MSKHVYAPNSGLYEVEKRVESLVGAAKGKGGVMLDSASADSIDAVKQSIADSKNLLPARMAKLLDRIEGEANKATTVASMLDGIARYKHKHGFMPSADLIDSVISQCENISDGQSTSVLPNGATLDSISSTNAMSTSLAHQPNRIAVAMTGGFSEAIPFGAYLPSDLNSNESKLAIISSIAGSNFGAYTAGLILDGTGGGLEYTRSERIVDVTLSTDLLTGTFKFTTQVAGAGDAVPLLRNRTAVVVAGITVAMEQSSDSGTDTSLISGQFTVGTSTQAYVITGSVNVTTGAGTLAFTPALPTGTIVQAQGFINFELNPALAPSINTIARSFSLYCAPSRVIMQITPDARTQTQTELGTDALTVAVQAARTQIANERYIAALRKIKQVAMRTARVWDFDYELQIAQKTRSQILHDFGSFVAMVDQEVANQTLEFGLGFMYCGAMGMSQFLSMDSSDFQPAPVSAKAGIWRVGTYKGKYEVYYSPWVVNETDTDYEILCIGRSAQVARNPVVFSDAVPATLIPLAINADLKQGAALFSRTLTEVNPHYQSALGCALITVKNVYAAA